MANKEINDFALKVAPVGTEEVLIQETGGGTTKKALISTLGGSGVSHLSRWNLSIQYLTLNMNPIPSWVEVNDGYLQPLGASMGYSAGIFQFPATGLWEVFAQEYLTMNTGSWSYKMWSGWNRISIVACGDYSTGPTWETRSLGSLLQQGHLNPIWLSANTKTSLRITDTVEQRVKFVYVSHRKLNINPIWTHVIFKRIGD